jgi:DNA helicase HerA-like ATPase
LKPDFGHLIDLRKEQEGTQKNLRWFETILQETANMSQEKSSVLGVLVEVTSQVFVAKLKPDLDGVSTDKMIGMDKVRIGQVGSYLMVRQADTKILCTVESMRTEASTRTNDINQLKLVPLGEFDVDGNFVRGINHYPTVGAEVHAVTNWNLERIFSDFSDVYYKVGKLSAFEAIDVYLDASAFFGRHAAILGQTGSGKSWTVTSLIQSALRYMPNAHIIVMDMHGEYGDKKTDSYVTSPFPASKVRCMDALELEMPYWLLAYSDLAEIFINPEDTYASVQHAFLRSSLSELRVESNRDSDIGTITVDSPVYFSLEELRDRFDDANQETLDFGRKKGPLFGQFDQLLVRMHSMMNDRRYDFMLKPKIRTSTESLVDLMKDFVGLGEPKANVTVLNLSAVPFDVAPTVTALIGRLAFEFNFWNPKCLEFPIWLVCEEAQMYIPRDPHSRFKEARRTMEHISKAGRKYGVGLCVVSQRPHEVSETVLAQCGSFLCLRISNPDDQDYLRAMVPDAARGTFSSLTSLARGEVVAMGAAVPMPVRFQMNLPNPPPNSSDVDFAGKWSKGGEEIDVKQLVSNWHRQIR